MKHLTYIMIVSISIIMIHSSCSKNDALPIQRTGGVSSTSSTTINVTTDHWEAKANGVFVNIFSNVIPATNAGHAVNVYLVSNGKDVLINQSISFMGGQLWAASAQEDVVITYRGNLPTVPYLNIKIVIG